MSALLMTWKVRNVFYGRFFSPTFYAENLKSTKWKLSLFFESIYLTREKADECLRKLEVEGKLIYITEDEIETSHKFTAELDEDEKYYVCSLDRSKIKFFDSFTIRCYLSQSSDFSLFVEYVAHTDFPSETYSIVRPALLPVYGYQEVLSNPIYLNVTSKYFSRFEILLKLTSEGIHVSIELKELKEEIVVKYKIKLMNMEDRLLTVFESVNWVQKNRQYVSFLVNRNKANVDTWTPSIKMSACFVVVPLEPKYTSDIYSTTYPLITCHALPENTRGDDVTSLNKKMKAMYVDKKLCDFTIRCRGREFQVHKVVLAAASPVFGAMLDVDMAEKQSSSVDIEDIEPDTVSKMIDFLYTDTMDELEWGICIDLYSAANKYQMQDLQQSCAGYMIKHLAVENVCEVLSMSDMHQDANLLTAAKDFVRSHSKQVLQSNQWRNFMEDNTKVACSTMYEICK